MVHKSSNVTRANFLRSDKAVILRTELEKMVKNPLYNTRVTTLLGDDHSYFIEKHMRYMSNHLGMDHTQYVKNLQLMTRLR